MFPGVAVAAGAPIAIGKGSSPPAIAVDSTGTAYIAWEDTSTSAPFVHYCELPAGNQVCSVSYTKAGQAGGLNPPYHSDCAGLLGSPSVIVQGADVLVFAYDNCTGLDNGVAGWVSTNGGKTFTNEPTRATMSYTPPNNDSVTVKPVTELGGGLVGVGYVVPGGSPQFQAVQYDPATSTFQTNYNGSSGSYATLDPTNKYAAGNLGGEFAAQPVGTAHAGLMGVVTAFPSAPKNPCHGAPQFTAWAFAPLAAGTTQTALNTNPGAAGSAWTQRLTPLDCNTTAPAVGGGPAGFGVLDTLFSGNKTMYHRFDEHDGKFDIPAVTLATEAEVSPSLSQDSAGGVYATWGTGLTELRLAYSPDGGTKWEGPVTLHDSTATGNQLAYPASAVDPAGTGWATYDIGGTEYAQPFTKADAIPPPVLGKSVDVAPVSGVVLVKQPGHKVFIHLQAGERIPLGSTVNATGGVVSLIAAKDRHGHTATGQAYGGVFSVTQRPAHGTEMTVLALAGPKPTGCRNEGCPGGRSRPSRHRAVDG